MKTLYSCQSLFFKHLYCILLFGLFTVTSSAQNWPEPNSTWEYCQEYGEQQFGTYTYAVTNDTLIADNVYSEIRLTHQNDEYIGESFIASNRQMYFRSSNDTIYRRVANSDYIFFINGLNVGDSFVTFRTNGIYFNQYSCTPEMELMVVAIDEIEANGESFNLYSLEDINFTDVWEEDLLPPNPIYQFIEGIGPNYNFPYFFPVATNDDPDYCNLDVKQIIAWEQLLSYNDGENSHLFGECIPTSLSSALSVEMKIYPNPVSENFRLENAEVGNNTIQSMILYNQQGQGVKSLNAQNRVHSLSDLPTGLYILQIETDNGLVWKKLLKE